QFVAGPAATAAWPACRGSRADLFSPPGAACLAHDDEVPMSTLEDPSINLDAYCDRIEYTGDRHPTVKTLMDLHLPHATHIPFENLDVMLKRPIRIDLESIESKLVRGRRGGYCFEQNLLFASVLRQIGFPVTLHSARVRLGAQRMLPRTHVCLAVDAEGDR